MAGNYDDGEIYYDNMEIMESIEKMKKSRQSPASMQSLKQFNPSPNSVEKNEKPPVLPPKKKNMVKSQSNAVKKPISIPTKSPPELTAKSQNRPLQTSVNKVTTPPASPKPVHVWNHPGLLRTRSIVEEPLAPIVEEEHDISPRDSFTESDASQESISSERVPEITQNGSRMDKSVQPVRKLQTIKPKVPLKSASENASHQSQLKDNVAVEMISHHDPGSKFDVSNLDVESENTVRPYGMVDVGWSEKNLEMNTRHIQPNGHSFTQKTPFMQASSPSKSPMTGSNNSIENGLRSNTGKRGSSTSLSSERESESRFLGSGASEESHESFRNSFDQENSSGVCAYMSIPIHSSEASISMAEKMHQRPLQQIGANAMRTNDHHSKNFYKDDEYIYDEIEDFAKDGASMQKALSDIDRVLESIGNEDISRTSSIAPKRFPVTTDKGNQDNAEYDNFFYRGNEQQIQSSRQNWNNRSKPTVPTTPPEQPNMGVNQSKMFNAARSNLPRPGNSVIHSPTGAFSSYVPAHSGVTPAKDDKRYDRFQSSDLRNMPRLDSGNNLTMVREDKDSGEREMSESSGSSVPYRSGISDHNTSASESRNKSRQSLDKTDSGSTSRKSSRADVEGSSEGDSQSFTGLHGETVLSRRKSAGNPLSSTENLRGSSRSLGRSNSCERKKSSFRSKFKFRSRSKSQDRCYGDSDSMGHLSGVSDVDEKVSHPRQRGSRLRRRLSRKRMESKDASDRKSLEGYDAEAERSRASTPVNFIRKLLRKSKSGDEDNSQSQRKLGPNSSGSEDSFSRTSSSGLNQSQNDPTRDKQLTSPPSRRARKMLHSRQAREKPVFSDSTNSDSDSGPGNFKAGETLKCGDEYLEPCEPNYQTKDSSKERGRKANNQRMKGRGRRTERDIDRSGVSSFHRDKYQALVSLNAQTLKKIAEKWLTEWRNRLPVGGFLITSWADIVIASKRPQCILGRTVIYEAYFSTNPGHRLACQIFDKTSVNNRLMRQLENCSTLIAHPNLCSVCSHFHCKIPGSLMYPPREETHSEALCVVLANVPATSLTTYVGRLREVKEQKQVHKQILLMVLQLLQALDNLSRSGFNLSYINADHLIVTQEMGLLQMLPHMADTDDTRTTSPGKPTMIQQISTLLSWMLQGCLDPMAMSSRPSNSSTYLASLKRISQVLTSSPHDFTIASLQSLVQCAVWGPRSSGDIDTTHESVLEALAAWIDVKQAELVSDIAVLFSAKSDFLPIYMFYKHQYFSRIDPKNLYQNLRILSRM